MTSIDPAAGAVGSWIAKWREREPEMAFAEVFCPRSARTRFMLWGALVFEWRQAAFELSDPRPTEVKCAWWADEALRCARAAPRHPLTVALGQPGLPWGELADGLLEISQAEPRRPVDRDAALSSVAPLAGAIALVETRLFASPGNADAARAVAVHLLCERLRVGLATADGGRIPLAILARHGITPAQLESAEGRPAVRDWARALLEAMPSRRDGMAMYRRARCAFDAWHLRAIASDGPCRMPSLRALSLAWQAARRGGPAG